MVNNTTIVNNTVLAPPAQVMAAKGQKPVTLDPETRQQARQQAAAVQQVAMQRTQTEVPSPGGPPSQPRTAPLSVPKAQAVTPGFVVPKPLVQQAAKPAPAVAPAARPAAAASPTTHQEAARATATGAGSVPHPADFEGKRPDAAAAKAPAPAAVPPANHAAPSSGGNPTHEVKGPDAATAKVSAPVAAQPANHVAPSPGVTPNHVAPAAAPAGHPSSAMPAPGVPQPQDNMGRAGPPQTGTAGAVMPTDPRAPAGRGNPAVKPAPPPPPAKKPPPKKDQQKDKDR